MTNFLDNIIALTFHYNESTLLSLTDCVIGSYNSLLMIEKYEILSRVNLSAVQFAIMKSAGPLVLFSSSAKVSSISKQLLNYAALNFYFD